MRSVRYSCFLLAVCALFASAASAAVSPEQYRAAIASSLKAARGVAKASPAPEGVGRLRRLRAQFPAAATVTVAGGAPIAAKNPEMAAFLAQAIQAKTPAQRRPALRRFIAHGETLQAALGTREPAPSAPATAAREPARSPSELRVLQAVLRRREFQESPWERWDKRVREWIQGVLQRMFGNLAPGALDTVARVLYWVGIAALVLLLAYLIWTYVPGLRFRRGARLAHAGAEEEILAPDSPAAHLAAAESAASAGRFLDAFRHTYTAMLLLLDRANVVAYDRARTNREVLRALRGPTHAPVRDLLLPVTNALDEKLYGGRPATADDYRWCRGECARLEGLLPP